MSFDFVVLGATGMQGRIVTRDLLEKGYSVLLCGRDKTRVVHFLKKYRKVEFRHIEATKIHTIHDAIGHSKAKVVVNCIEGNWNDKVLEVCCHLGVNVIDLGSEIPMTKRQLAMDSLCKKKGMTAITGIGSVPGVGSIMLRYAAEKFDKLESIDVGFSWDSNIKRFVVPFSIESVVEEFTEPAPVVIRGKFVKKIPLHSIIKKYHRGIGKEMQFYVRHPEQYTFYHYFKNRGLKNVRFYAGFPDHSFKVIKDLMDLGFAENEKINYFGVKIKPINFLTQLLKKLQIPKGYKEKENLWIKIRGIKNGKAKTILMECLVPSLKSWEDAGCNIDTGFPASILAIMLKDGIITDAGSFAPEAVVPPIPFFKELRKRHMVVYENGMVIN